MSRHSQARFSAQPKPKRHARAFIFVAAACASLAGCARHEGSAPQADDGIVSGRSIGSRNAEAKSVVAIVADLDGGQALCTGSLIDEETVLTAAHCVDHEPESLTLVFSADIQRADDDHRRAVLSFVQNPRWKKPTARGKGDLALVHFSGGLPEGYAPVHLASAREALLSDDTSVLLIGYGVTDGLSHAGAGRLRSTVAPVIGKASPTEVVTDGKASSVCFGDSGGPAFVQVEREWRQWGVASSVTNESCNEASIHTNVASYLRWIKTAATKLADEAGSDPDDEVAAPRLPARRAKRRPVELFVPDEDAAQANDLDGQI